MAIAKITFPGNITPVQKLKDIAKFCAGQIANVSNFEFALPSLSNISNATTGWSLMPTTAFEATGTATRSYYNLSSTTATGSAKYCQLKCFSPFKNIAISSSPSISTISSTIDNSNAALCILASNKLDQNGELSNPATYIEKAYSTFTTATLSRLYDNSNVDLTATDFYIIASNKKIIICSIGTSTVSVYGLLEFTPNYTAQVTNSCPLFVFSSSSLYKANSTTAATSTPFFTFESSELNTIKINTTVSTSGTSYIWRKAFLIDYYNFVDRLMLTRDVSSDLTDMLFAIPPMLTTATGLPLFTLQEMIVNRMVDSGAVRNYSSYSDTYLMSRPSTLVTSGDEVSDGTNSYIIFTVGNSTDGFVSIATKKE